MLNMATYVLAGLFAQQEDVLLIHTEDIDGRSPTPVDIKLDIGTLSNKFPPPPELWKPAEPGRPLELKVSLVAPNKSEKQAEEKVRQVHSSRLRSPSIHWDGGIEVGERTPYKPHKRNGTPRHGWPMPEEWLSYKSM
jgi:hypothetical protein